MTPSVKRQLDRWASLKTQRDPWESHWQELADAMRPTRGGFRAEEIEGAKRTENMFDSAPMIAVRGLASAVEGMLTPKTSQWFKIKAELDDLNNDDDAKAWFDDAEGRMWRAIYSAPARFSKAFAEAYLDLVTFGTGIVFMGENLRLREMTFRAIHLKNVWLASDESGGIDTLYLGDKLTARQAAQRWGEENLGKKTKEALKMEQGKESRDRKFQFLHVVLPREDRKEGKTNKNMPFASLVIDVDSEHLVEESGFHEFPYSVMRWDTAAGEDYGRSPGMMALPDAKTLHQMGKTLLEAGHKAVDPPVWTPADSIASTAKSFPGGITYFDAEALAGTGLRQPFFPMQTGANMPLGREMQNDVRNQIFSAFFKNVLNLPTDGPQMTATEVVERKQEFIRTVGPTFGRLEADGPAMVVERVFGVMARAGALAPAPESLQGKSVKFEYASPVEGMRKQIEAASGLRTMEFIGPFIQVDQSILDNFDFDRMARDVPEAADMPRSWIRHQDDVNEIRQSRAEAQQQAAEVEGALSGAERVAGIAKDLPPEVLDEEAA